MENTLSYEGCNYIRQRLILATLSGRSVKIKKIRHKDDDPGLKEFEASFIRLFDSLTNGSTIVVSESGTGVFYQPGMLTGGNITHDCSTQRSIGYYLEALLCVAPFTKKPLRCVLRGVTNDQTDPSVDLIKYSSLPLLKRFLGTDDGLELKVTRRGAAPDGGGEVVFNCPCRQKLRPLQYISPGKIKRIRGVAWASRVSPQTCNRVVDSARGVLNQFLPDIYIHTDHARGAQSGKSPGFGLTLVAETQNGTFLCAEQCSNPRGATDYTPTVPEDLGRQASYMLLDEIYRGGCVDSTNQSLAALMMSLGDKDVSKLQVGPLSPYTIQFLRHLRDFFQVVFKMDVDKMAASRQGNEDDTGGGDGNEESPLRLGGEKIILTCVGVGFKNLSKVTL